MKQDYQNKTDGILCFENGEGALDFGTRLHSNVELVMVRSGEIRVWVGKGEAEIAREGDVIIIFPNQQYRYEAGKNGSCILVIANIRRLGEFLGILTSYSPRRSVIKGVAEESEVSSLFESVLNIYKEDESEYRESVLKGYVTALLGRILQTAELERNGIEKTNTAGEIMDFCNIHYRERLSLEYLERELHISKYYISHVINERMGISFSDYVSSIRIGEAQRLLSESDKPIKEISAEVGFGTIRSFDRAFKRQKGETPREYRQRILEKKKKD